MPIVIVSYSMLAHQFMIEIKNSITPLLLHLPQSFLKLKHKCKATVRSRVWHIFLLSNHIKLKFSVSRWSRKKKSRLCDKMKLLICYLALQKHANPNQTSTTPQANFYRLMLSRNIIGPYITKKV